MMHATGKKLNRPRFPQPGDKILVGLSQGQPYHDDPKQLSKQFEYLNQYQPSEIHPFLSDVAHYQTNIIGDLLKFTGEKETYDADAAAKASILNLYQQGSAWRDNQAPLLSELEPTVKPVGQWLEWDADLRALLNEADTEQTITMPNIEGVEAEQKNAYFKSICLNMKIYYLQGRLILMNAQTEPHKEVCDEIENSLKSCMKALKTHNEWMEAKRFRDPFYQMAFDETSKTKKAIAREIAEALLSDATHFLNKKKYVEGDEITANSLQWQHQLAIEYSTSYMIKNFAVVGIYTMFNDFDYYYYPRKTTNALLVFTDQCLTTIIDTLTDQSGAIAHDPLSKKQNDFIAITPFISTPVDISDIFINRLKHTIECIHADWNYPGSSVDCLEILNNYKVEGIQAVTDAFAYWKNDERIQALRHRSKSSNAFIQPDQDEMYDEALMYAKTIVGVAVNCMRLALSKINMPSKDDMKADINAFQDSAHGYRKAYHAYQNIHTLFAVFLTALRADFSTDKLDGHVDNKLIDKMEVMLKSIKEEKIFYKDNFQIMGHHFMTSYESDLDHMYQDTECLMNRFNAINGQKVASVLTTTEVSASDIAQLHQSSIFSAEQKSTEALVDNKALVQKN